MILRRITARQDPRWLPFLRELDRAPEQLAKIAFTVAVPGAAAPAGMRSGAAPPVGATSASTATSLPAQTSTASTGQLWTPHLASAPRAARH
jgi:hypothetical protein